MISYGAKSGGANIVNDSNVSHSGGMIFPEKTSPNQSDDGTWNQFEIIVAVSSPSTTGSMRVYIGYNDIGNWITTNSTKYHTNDNTRNDNYGSIVFVSAAGSATIGSDNGLAYVDIPAGQISATVTAKIVGAKDSNGVAGGAHAGDNWVFYAAWDTPNGRMKTSYTESLTVWRTLNVECDRMAKPGTDIEVRSPSGTLVDTYFKTSEKGITWNDDVPVPEPMTFDLRKQPDKPDISLLNTLLNQACVMALEYQYNNTPVVDFVPLLTLSQTEYNNPVEISQLGKEIPNATNSYWTMYILGAYESGSDHDHHVGMPYVACPAFMNGVNQGNAYVFCETIRDVTNTHGNCPGVTGTLADYNTFFKRVVAHEILHSFLGSHVDPENHSSPSISDQKIMNYNYIYAGWNCSLNVEQIKKIQAADKPKPASQI